jgi:hypothetical protein
MALTLSLVNSDISPNYLAVTRATTYSARTTNAFAVPAAIIHAVADAIKSVRLTHLPH